MVYIISIVVFDDDDDGDLLFELNRKAKFVINGRDVYYGVIVSYDESQGLLKLLVRDWRDRERDYIDPRPIVVHISNVTVDYVVDDVGGDTNGK